VEIVHFDKNRFVFFQKGIIPVFYSKGTYSWKRNVLFKITFFKIKNILKKNKGENFWYQKLIYRFFTYFSIYHMLSKSFKNQRNKK